MKVFNVPNFDTPVSQKNFFKGDKVQLKWNDQGTSLIVLAQTEVDRSGKTYDGETTLYLLSANGGFDSRIDLGIVFRRGCQKMDTDALQTRMALSMTLHGHPTQKNSAWCTATRQLKPPSSIAKPTPFTASPLVHGTQFSSPHMENLCWSLASAIIQAKWTSTIWKKAIKRFALSKLVIPVSACGVLTESIYLRRLQAQGYGSIMV